MLSQVLEQLGIPPALGNVTVKISRVLTALKRPHKKQFLPVTFAMIANGVLPVEGQKKAWRNAELTQDELAKAVGLESRASLTKRISILRGEARSKDGALKAGNALLPLLKRKKRFARPNKYEYTSVFPEKKGTQWTVYRISTGKSVPRAQFGGPDPEAAYERACKSRDKLNKRLGQNDYGIRSKVMENDCFWYPTADDIFASPKLLELFDPGLLFELDACPKCMGSPENKLDPKCEECSGRGWIPGERKFSGDADIPVWIWHPSLGISDTARMVLTFYWMCGLGAKDSAGNFKGWIQPKQSTVAKRLGISTRAVHDANVELGCPVENEWEVYVEETGRTVRTFGHSDSDKAQQRAKKHAEKLAKRADRQTQYAVRCKAPATNKKPYGIGIIRVVGTIHSKGELMTELNAARASAGKEGPERVPAQFHQEWRRENIILFLPYRTMTDLEIWAERRRLLYARKALHTKRKAAKRRRREMELESAQAAQMRHALALQCCKAARLHRKVVESFKGQTARVSRIWAAVQAELLSAGIDHRLIANLIPLVHDPPPPVDAQKIAEVRAIVANSAWESRKILHGADPAEQRTKRILQAKLEQDRKRAAQLGAVSPGNLSRLLGEPGDEE